GLETRAHVLLERRSLRQRLALGVVDHLRIDVLGRPEHREPSATVTGAPDAAPHLCGPPDRSVNDCRHRQLPLLLLPFLAEDGFAGIFHTLALVRFGLAERSDLGRDLSHPLVVDAADHDLGRLRDHDRDAVRDRKGDVMGIAELQLQGLALQCRTIADPGDFELALVALGHTLNELGHQRTRRAPQRARLLGIVARIDVHAARIDLNRNVVVQHDLQGALGALHLDRLTLDIGDHARGDCNRLLADTRHGVIPSVFAPQNTVQRISPPTLASRASWSAITPFGVETIATPRPLFTRGKFRTEA